MPRANTETMEELEAKIAARYHTMPLDERKTKKKAGRADIKRALAGGKRLTAREIARVLHANTRAIQLALCNPGWGWIGREKPRGGEFVYFLTGNLREAV